MPFLFFLLLLLFGSTYKENDSDTQSDDGMFAFSSAPIRTYFQREWNIPSDSIRLLLQLDNKKLQEPDSLLEVELQTGLLIVEKDD